jgi:hypothetical protein
MREEMNRPQKKQCDAGLVDTLNSMDRGVWCSVTDLHSRVLSWVGISRNSDWEVQFAEVVREAETAGWEIVKDRSLYPNFACQKNGKRVFVRFWGGRPINPYPAVQPLPSSSASIEECFLLLGP